jgi:hypothetical protein
MSIDSFFLKTLQDDVMAALDAYYREDNSYNRRIVVRVFASAVEGEIYHLKQHCLKRLDSNTGFYTTGEAAVLRESSYYLDKDSTVLARPQFFSTPENFHFVLKAFAKDTLPNLDIRDDTAGWANFKNAFHLRNRVTHPKTEADLAISDEELGCIQRAFIWFRKVLTHTQVVSGLALHDSYEKLRYEMQQLGRDPGPSVDPCIIPRDELVQWAARLDQLEIPPSSKK